MTDGGPFRDLAPAPGDGCGICGATATGSCERCLQPLCTSHVPGRRHRCQWCESEHVPYAINETMSVVLALVIPTALLAPVVFMAVRDDVDLSTLDWLPWLVGVCLLVFPAYVLARKGLRRWLFLRRPGRRFAGQRRRMFWPKTVTPRATGVVAIATLMPTYAAMSIFETKCVAALFVATAIVWGAWWLARQWPGRARVLCETAGHLEIRDGFGRAIVAAPVGDTATRFRRLPGAGLPHHRAPTRGPLPCS